MGWQIEAKLASTLATQGNIDPWETLGSIEETQESTKATPEKLPLAKWERSLEKLDCSLEATSASSLES